MRLNERYPGACRRSEFAYARAQLVLCILMLITRYMDYSVDIDGYPTDDDYSVTDGEWCS